METVKNNYLVEARNWGFLTLFATGTTGFIQWQWGTTEVPRVIFGMAFFIGVVSLFIAAEVYKALASYQSSRKAQGQSIVLAKFFRMLLFICVGVSVLYPLDPLMGGCKNASFESSISMHMLTGIFAYVVDSYLLPLSPKST